MPGALLQAPTVGQPIAARIVQGYACHPAQRLSGDLMAAWQFAAQPTTMGIQPVPSQQALQQERLPERPWPPRVPTTRRPIIRHPITRLTIPDDGGSALTGTDKPSTGD